MDMAHLLQVLILVMVLQAQALIQDMGLLPMVQAQTMVLQHNLTMVLKATLDILLQRKQMVGKRMETANEIRIRKTTEGKMVMGVERMVTEKAHLQQTVMQVQLQHQVDMEPQVRRRLQDMVLLLKLHLTDMVHLLALHPLMVLLLRLLQVVTALLPVLQYLIMGLLQVKVQAMELLHKHHKVIMVHLALDPTMEHHHNNPQPVMELLQRKQVTHTEHPQIV